jgi:hypothetical protein
MTGGRHGRDCMVAGYTTIYITTKVVSLNPFHSEVYSVQHYALKFVSNIRQSSSIHRNDIIEILLKVALNTMNKPTYNCYVYVINVMYYFDNGEYFC